MNEAKFQTLFNKWAQHNMKKTFVFELKFTEKDNLPYNAVKEHQIDHLSIFNKTGYAYKIPDLGNRNPFDGYFTYRVPAYIVIMFYQKGKNEFVMIDIDEWIKQLSYSQVAGHRKSITEKEAKQIGKTYKVFEDILET